MRQREGWRAGGGSRGKKKEERIKRRVPVDLPIDNGFHLYNSTPRATLNPFCLFSLMLFYHPFAAVFHVSPITCHPRTYAPFLSPKFSPLLLHAERTRLMSLLLPSVSVINVTSTFLSACAFLRYKFANAFENVSMYCVRISPALQVTASILINEYIRNWTFK